MSTSWRARIKTRPKNHPEKNGQNPPENVILLNCHPLEEDRRNQQKQHIFKAERLHASNGRRRGIVVSLRRGGPFVTGVRLSPARDNVVSHSSDLEVGRCHTDSLSLWRASERVTHHHDVSSSSPFSFLSDRRGDTLRIEFRCHAGNTCAKIIAHAAAHFNLGNGKWVIALIDGTRSSIYSANSYSDNERRQNQLVL